VAIEMAERLADLARLGPAPEGMKVEPRADGVEITIARRYTPPMNRGIDVFVGATMALLFVLAAAAALGPDSVWTVVIFVVGIGTVSSAAAGGTSAPHSGHRPAVARRS
jgi:hypothetical protein